MRNEVLDKKVVLSLCNSTLFGFGFVWVGWLRKNFKFGSEDLEEQLGLLEQVKQEPR